VRALVPVATILAAAAGCGGGRQGWPDCLRVLGAPHVRVASDLDLAHAPRFFAATRAAAVDFSDGSEATIVVSRTSAAAAAVAVALRDRPSVIDTPGPDTPLHPSDVVRRGRAVLQRFGTRDRAPEHVLLECSTR
jgi:hypothetical protein